MSKHTPGPWVLSEAVENRFQKTDMRRVRSANEGTEHGAVCEVYGIRDGSTAAANARLIAAAPDLLEALQMVEDAYRDHLSETGEHSIPYSPLAKIRAAIAKATGEA